MDDLRKQAIVEAANEILAPAGLFTADSVYTHTEPHPYCITPHHVAHASDKFMGMLGEEAIESLERKNRRGMCGVKGCRLTYDEHKTSYILMLNLTRDMGNKEAAEALSTLKPLAERECIEGFGFLNLNKEFKIAPPEKE